MFGMTIRMHTLFLVLPRKMMITIVMGRGGGQRVVIEIIISVNDENDGRSLKFHVIENFSHSTSLKK